LYTNNSGNENAIGTRTGTEQEQEKLLQRNLKTECCMLALVELLQNLHPYPLLYIPFHVNKFLEVEHGGNHWITDH
jgi:hypothetical protein